MTIWNEARAIADDFDRVLPWPADSDCPESAEVEMVKLKRASEMLRVFATLAESQAYES